MLAANRPATASFSDLRSASSARRYCSMWSRTSYCRRRARSAPWMVLNTLSGRTGRSSSSTLPSGCRNSRCFSLCRETAPRHVSRMSGKSDQRGCASTACFSLATSGGPSASSATIRTPAPRATSSLASCAVRQAWHGMLARSSSSHSRRASRPEGVNTSARISYRSLLLRSDTLLQLLRFSAEARSAGQHALEPHQRLAHVDAARAEAQLADGALMRAATLLQDRERLPHRAVGFEVAEQQDRIGQVAHVHRRLHVAAHEAALRQRHQCGHAAPVQVREQLVQLEHKEFFTRHRVEEAIQAVDDDQLRVLFFYRHARPRHELARRDLC